MECSINGIPAWEHPKQMGCGSADTTSISTGSSSVSRGIDDGTAPPSSPLTRSTFLNLLPTRNNNASSSSSSSKKRTSALPASPISSSNEKVLAPSSPIRPPLHQMQQPHRSSNPAAQHAQNRTPNKSMDHRRMLNMGGYASPNKMMISFDSDSQSCCPSVGDITWDHTEAMAFHNATAPPHRQQRQQSQQQHPWENFKEMKLEPLSSTTSKALSNSNGSPILAKNKNRVFPTPAVAQLQQQLRSKPQPIKPQQRRRNSIQNVVISSCPSIPDSTLLPVRPNKSQEISLSPLHRANSTTSSSYTSRPTSSMYMTPSQKDSPTRKVVFSQKPSIISTAPTAYAKENYATEIKVNFSDCFVSPEEDVPTMIAVESSKCPSTNIGRKFNTNAAVSSIDSNMKSTKLQPRKEIDVMHPNTIVVVPFREKRTEHLRSIPPISTSSNSSKEDPLSGTTITTTRTHPPPPLRSRSNSYGSNSMDLLHHETCSTYSAEKGQKSFHNSIITVPMSNITTIEGLGNKDYQSDALSKPSSSSRQRQNYDHQPTSSNPNKNSTTPLNLEGVRNKSSSRVDDAAFQKWNISKSSVSTSKSSKSVSSHRSSSYNTVQQLEESIQNLEATLQMKTSNHQVNTQRTKESDDRLVNLALESSFNDIYLRPSTSDKRSTMQHRHPHLQQQHQQSQESFSGISASMLSMSMMSSSLLSTMSMNTNNSMLFQQRRQPQPAIPPNLLIQIDTNATAINTNSTSSGREMDDYSDIKTAMALSSAIMDH